MGFKHAHSGFGTVCVGAVVAHSALCCGGHFVAICKVSFQKSLFFLPIFVYFGTRKREAQNFSERSLGEKNVEKFSGVQLFVTLSLLLYPAFILQAKVC